jgi:hypothetical protein
MKSLRVYSVAECWMWSALGALTVAVCANVFHAILFYFGFLKPPAWFEPFEFVVGPATVFCLLLYILHYHRRTVLVEIARLETIREITSKVEAVLTSKEEMANGVSCAVHVAVEEILRMLRAELPDITKTLPLFSQRSRQKEVSKKLYNAVMVLQNLHELADPVRERALANTVRTLLEAEGLIQGY